MSAESGTRSGADSEVEHGRLTGRVALVTGASRGIGRAIAEALAAEGALLALAARSERELESLAAGLGEGDTQTLALPCDVTDPDPVGRAVARTVEQFGRIDVLVNNAGVGKRAKIEELSVEDWDRTFAVNLRGVFLMTRAVVPHMKRQGGGHVVNVSSVAGLVGNPGLSCYNATKFGLMGFSESLMLELRHDRIKVTAICPGSTDSDFSGSGQGSPGRENYLHVDDVAKVVVDVLATSDNALVSQVHLRPLVPPRRG